MFASTLKKMTNITLLLYLPIHINKKSLVTKGTFLHNTKVTISNINEDKMCENRKDSNHAKGREINQMEILHVISKYPEVYTDLHFVAFPAMIFELRAGIEIEK